MLITIDKASMVVRGLQALDGYTKVVKDGDKEKTVTEFYKFSGNFRLMLAINQNKLENIIEQFQKQQQKVFKEYFPSGDSKNHPEEVVKYQETVQEMLDSEIEIDVTMIEEGELKLNENPIPHSVLRLILPLIGQKEG